MVALELIELGDRELRVLIVSLTVYPTTVN